MQFDRSIVAIVTIIVVLATLTILYGLNRPAPVQSISAVEKVEADIIITGKGCAATNFTLAAQREPQITLYNQSTQAMVFTLPKMALALTVEPHQVGTLHLPRYIMGRFAFFCLTETAHTRLNGGMPGDFVCSLDPREVGPYALTSGTFVIEPHTRIEELGIAAPQRTQ